MTAQTRDENNHPFSVFRFGTVHKVAYTDTAGVISGTISNKCRAALIWCSTDAHIAIGDAPTADTNDAPVTAKVHLPIRVVPGDKISAVQQSAAGDLYVIELF